jgi:hypothetical protein
MAVFAEVSSRELIPMTRQTAAKRVKVFVRLLSKKDRVSSNFSSVILLRLVL